MYENLSKGRPIADNYYVHALESATRVTGKDEALAAAVTTFRLDALWRCVSGESPPPMSRSTIGQIREWALRQLVFADEVENRTMLVALISLMQRHAETSMISAARSAELTHAERRIIATVLTHPGRPNKALADALCISKHTLRNHLASIYAKLSIHRRMELAQFGFESDCDCGDCMGE